MAKSIPKTFIRELLSQANIVDVIGKRLRINKTLEENRPSGEDFMRLQEFNSANNFPVYFALCPFHEEKLPPFCIYPTLQKFHCRCCGVAGNAIYFLMKYEKVDFQRAVEILADSYGLDVPYENGTK